jgi:hypothetical protein
VIEFVSDLRQVCRFLQVLQFPLQIKLTAAYFIVIIWISSDCDDIDKVPFLSLSNALPFAGILPLSNSSWSTVAKYHELKL